MPGPRFRDGDVVSLHTVEADDLPYLHRLVNDPRVRQGLPTHRPKTMDDERTWYESLGDDAFGWMVCVDDTAVGTVGLTDVDQTTGCAEVGYFLDPAEWGNGYASDAVETVVAYGFDELRLHKVYANVYACNDASIGVLESAGFSREGVHREEGFIDGEHVDVYRYGILASTPQGSI